MINYGLQAKSNSLPVFAKVLLEYITFMCLHMVYSCFLLRWQSSVVVTETKWLTELKICTFWPFKKKLGLDRTGPQSPAFCSCLLLQQLSYISACAKCLPFSRCTGFFHVSEHALGWTAEEEKWQTKAKREQR